MTKKKMFVLPRQKGHDIKRWQSPLATSVASNREMIERTPVLKSLYEFLERPLPDGSRQILLRSERRKG